MPAGVWSARGACRIGAGSRPRLCCIWIWTASAAWRYLETLPPAWRYLAARQHDSFYTSMTLIDVVGGYELPSNIFYEQRFHRALDHHVFANTRAHHHHPRCPG